MVKSNRIMIKLIRFEVIVSHRIQKVNLQYKSPPFTNANITICNSRRERYKMKATGIVRRIDDLGRVVIPKEIRRTMRIREGDPPRQH